MKNPRLVVGLTTIIVLVGASYALFLRVRQGGLSRLSTAVAKHEPLFSDGTKDTLDPLIAVQDRALDIKISLKCLAVNAPSSGIEIREANSLAKILPYQVGQF